MRYLKMLGLSAVAAGALIVILGAGSASATVLCSTTVDPCPGGQKWVAGTFFDFSIPSGQSALKVNTAGETLDTCSTSTIDGEITKVGSSTETTTAHISEKTWGSCTFSTKTLKTAAIEIHRIAGTSNGTMTSDGTTETTINTVLFGSCIYGVKSGGSVGDITEGNPAILHFNSVTEKLSGSAFACPATNKFTATYTMTSPAGTTLSVENS